MGLGEEKARAKANVNLNVTIQAGVSIMGSKNVVVFNGKREVSKDSIQVDEPLAGRKRMAESVSCHHACECFSRADTNVKVRSPQISRWRWGRRSRSKHSVANGTT